MRGGGIARLSLASACLTLLAACGSDAGTANSGTSSQGSSTLAPAIPGFGQCGNGNGSLYPQGDGTAVAQIHPDNISCTTAVDVTTGADTAKGAPYSRDGYSCTATQQTNPQDGNFVSGQYWAYSCVKASSQVAFAWGNEAGTSGATAQPGGTLAPAVVGQGQCPNGANGATYPASDGTEVAQINPGSTPCSTAVDVSSGADGANGGPYTKDGYSCTATQQTNQQDGNFVSGQYWAFSCVNGSSMIAFAWGKRA